MMKCFKACRHYFIVGVGPGHPLDPQVYSGFLDIPANGPGSGPVQETDGLHPKHLLTERLVLARQPHAGLI